MRPLTLLSLLVLSSVSMSAMAEAATLSRSSFLSSRLGVVSLNPQPLPPGGAVSLNPQPLPPGGAVSLNPQPLPPGGGTLSTPSTQRIR